MVSKGDFVKVEYTGYDQSGNVFDSTSGDIARQLHGKEGAMLIVLGVDFLVQGMEEALYSMKKGEEREITAPPEKAFGTRTRTRLKIFSMNEFHHNEVDPYPGAVIQMQTEFGALNGVVKSVNSGRVLIDFNHPLADQSIKYKLRLADVISDPAGKIGELVKDLAIDGTCAVEGTKAVITMKKGQEDEKGKKAKLEIAVKGAIPEIKQVEFKEL